MFSKSKTKEPEATPVLQAVAAKRMTRNTAPSIISGDLVVKGTLIASGDIQVDGRVEGDIRANSLVVGEKASIEGDLYAEEATVRGHVVGSIRARKVQLCATCRVEGNILHEALSMESGAFFEGNCRHSDNPLAEGAESANPARKQQETFERKPANMSAPSGAATAKPTNGETAAAMAQGNPPMASFAPLKA